MQAKAWIFKLLIVSGLITLTGLQFAAHQGPAPFTFSPVQNSNVAAAASSFNGALAYVIAGGYIAMFICMVIEGPMITAAASFAAALGYFNIGIVFLLAVAGDLTGDIVYYIIGYFSRVAFVEKYGARLGVSRARMQKLERLLGTHPGKTLLFIKVFPGIATPGLMMVGATRMSIKKFASLCLSIILPKVLLFVCLGYYFGHAYVGIAQYVQYAEYFIVAAVIATLCVYYIYTKMTTLLAQRLGTI